MVAALFRWLKDKKRRAKNVRLQDGKEDLTIFKHCGNPKHKK